MAARLTLLLAALPAIVGSVLLMRGAGVPDASIVLQLAVFGAGGGMLAFGGRSQRRSAASGFPCWMSALLVALLFVPVAIDAGDGPHRWITLGGVRVYLASVILPALLLWLNRVGSESVSGGACLTAATVGACVALLLHPDAAQLGAFGVAMLPIVIGSRLSRVVRLAVLGVIAACTSAAWQRPDPLGPVAHVEGVFALAAAHGAIALVAAVCAAALPAATLLWHARREQSAGVLAVAMYYLAILAHAPLQITPVPLLGFGAGPILGYCIVALMAARELERTPALRAR